jgi:hypothetical protein
MRARAWSLAPGLAVAAALLVAFAAVAEEEPAGPAGSEGAVEGFHPG